MTKSWDPRRGRRRYDRAGSVVLNRVKLGQAPVSLHRLRWMHRGLWILLAIAVAGGGLALWLTVDSRFYVYDAQIVGNRRLSHQEIFEASRLGGLHILWARSATIESRILEALPSLESVEVGCRLPANCSISVVERRPRVLWDESGELWWIDEEGAVFPGMASMPVRDDGASSPSQIDADAPTDSLGQWVVRGPLPREDGRGKDYLEEQVRVALVELWENGRHLPSEYQYDPEQGLSFVDAHGWRVIVGQGSGMARRLEVLEQLVTHLESQGVAPRFVDVRFPEAPYYAAATD